MKKHILIIADSLGYGGLQKITAFIANSCVTHNLKVTVISMKNTETKQFFLEKVNVIKLNFIDTKNNIRTFRQLMKTSNELKQVINKESPDLIIAMGNAPLLISKLSCLGQEIKIIGAERNSPSRYSLIWKLINKWLFSTTSINVFQTKIAMNYYGKLIRKKSVVIPNPYIKNNEITQPFFGEREKVITAAAARFEDKKGFEELIKAFSIVNKEHPDYTLVIYGDGELYQKYVNLAKDLNIHENVQFPGKIDNVAKTIYKSSVFVLPSKFEGIPNILMEVMGVGVPVVATDCHPGGPKLLTKNGDYGKLVPVNNIQALADGIQEIIDNNELSLYYSINGMKHMETFSEQKIKRKWIDLILKLI